MIVQDLIQLPQFEPGAVVICDIESTSWNDEVKALNPFRGHRVAGYALATSDGQHSWYLPIRHHGAPPGDLQNLPLDNVLHYMRDLYKSCIFANHNAKFDARFMHFDGIKFAHNFQDSIVLARLVDDQRDKRFGGKGYSLDALAEDYLGARKDNRIKAYVKAIGSKDFGRVPIHLLGEYAQTDAKLAARLRLKLLRALPERSLPIWAIEQRVSKLLLDGEIYGIPLNVERLKANYLDLMQRLVILLQQIQAIAGREVNIASPDDVNKFMQQMGIKPNAWTDTGAPSWSAINLEMVTIPPGVNPDLGKIVSLASRLSHHVSNYCQGWLEVLGDDGRLHPDFLQWGTVTGRLSSSGPNVQNMDELCEAWVREVGDRILVYFDLSQAEYRIFGHYTQSPLLLEAYRKDPDADFHQWLADKIGVSRAFAKTMNFSFIYGMSKRRLLETLTALLKAASLRGMDERISAKLYMMTKGGMAAKAAAHLFQDSDMAAASEQLYNEYHQLLPEILAFQRRISNLCRARGWIRNYYGRTYKLSAKLAYIGVNRIVQGTVGDYMKERAATLWERCSDLAVHMIDEVHDSSVWSVPRASLVEFHKRAFHCFEESDFRIPMRADCKISAASWSQMQKVGRDATPEDLEAALAASIMAPYMTWDRQETRKFEGTSKRAHGQV